MKKVKSKVLPAPSNLNQKFQKVAIVHNWVWKMRGAERCLKELCRLFPNADIYLMFGDKVLMSTEFRGHHVYFSSLQRVPLIRKAYKLTLPLWPITVEQFDLRGYDLVISSSAAVAHGVITDPKTPHVCYLYSPMRYIWDQRDLYFGGMGGLFHTLIAPWLHFLRIWDTQAAKRPDVIVPISEFVRRRAEKFWKVKMSEVIYPPVKLRSADLSSTERKEFFIAISPFEENKGAVEMVEAAVKYGFKLKLTGDGALKKRCEQLVRAAGASNVEFLGWVSEVEKERLLGEATGLLSLGIEDFGIVTVEAIDAGCPVIVRNEGGAREIVKNEMSGVIVESVTSESIHEAVTKLRNIEFDEHKMKSSVARFSEENFANQLETVVKSC